MSLARNLERLRTESSADSRRAVAAEIGARFRGGTLSERERALASEIFRILVRDTEIMVRKAMAESLAASPLVPGDIAVALARDLNEVAVPVLEHSDVLSDDDLIAIIRAPYGPDSAVPEAAAAYQPGAKLAAVARRRVISSTVCVALVDHGDETLILELVANNGADLDPPAAHHLLDRFGDLVRVQVALVDRKAVPISVLERIAFRASEAVRDRIVSRHDLPEVVSERITRMAQEKAMLALIGDDPEGRRAGRLAANMCGKGRMTGTLLLRALFTGEIRFAEAAFAGLAQVSVVAVRDRIRYGSALELRRLYRRTGLSGELFPIISAAVELSEALDRDGASRTGPDRMAIMLERTIARAGKFRANYIPHAVDGLDLEYVLARVAAMADQSDGRGAPAPAPKIGAATVD
ncbi:MAG: DUF2336 domain-containing protein [Alphaproteobacteria bacterium]|nr:DUF2336 domain-containing protein [Alphaproteobacteria bacterium]